MLLTCPAEAQRAVDGGVLLKLIGGPDEWNKEAYKEMERMILQHLCVQYFFNRERPEGGHVAPFFDYPNIVGRL
jgi:hypothetical protein